jgi:hypothetical protein
MPEEGSLRSSAAPADLELTAQGDWRREGRDTALRSALRKRQAGVPTFTVAETAALFSVSPEHMYRLVRADAFPAIRMCLGQVPGRYVVPASAVEQLLADASSSGGLVDSANWAKAWRSEAREPQ